MRFEFFTTSLEKYLGRINPHAIPTKDIMKTLQRRYAGSG